MPIINNEKKILNYLKEDDSCAKLPVIYKDENGSWVFSGEYVTISTIEEFNQYKEICSEIYDIIQQNFKTNIAAVYKKSLNSLISYDDKSKISELLSMFLKGKSVTLGKIFGLANSENETDLVASINHIVNGVNKVNGKSEKVFKPFKFLAKGNDYVFPEFSENGVVAKVEDKKISVKFKFVNAVEAEALKNYMFECIPGESLDAERLRNFVNSYFLCSKHAADLVKKSASLNELYQAFSELNEASSVLFDTDLTDYKKTVKNTAESYTVPEIEYVESPVDDITETQSVSEENQKVNGFDFKTEYKTEFIFNEGGPVIRISPVDSSFVVSFDKKSKTYLVDKYKQLGE